MSKWSTDETELDLIKALAGGNGLPTSETWFEGEMMSNARKQHLLIARSKEPPVSAKERHLGTKRGKPFGSGGGEDTDDRYKTNMQGFGPGAWLEGEDAKHKAEYKAMARQRLERAEQRGTQVLGGHHYLAAVTHVEDLTPHDEARSRRGEDLGEIGSWYKGPPPQHPREKAFGKFAGVAADPHRPGAYGDGGGSSSVLRRQSSSYGGAPGRSNSPLQNASPNAIRGGTPGKTSSQAIGGWWKPEMAVKEAHVVQSSSTSKKLEVLGGHADFH